MPGALRSSHFKVVQQFKADYAPTTLTQYRSDRTGLNVVVVDQKGPKVQGYFALATEIHDDSGAPHTLEHLVFMGSKSYKYKGVLDKLANRAYSNTNAWTAVDHTAYTLDTAGWEGFALILPIYLEHVILPTLTDEGCYTEVHHVDGEGNDAGVVYSEMQGVQNTGGSLMDLEARRLLYPEGVGYRYETGGMMEQLRVLTADRIREFHREMYQPKNLCLVLVGEVDHDNLLEILDEFEDGILGEIPRPDAPFTRPWVDSAQVQPLKKSIIETVEFPEEDESQGDILVGFLGPDCNDNVATAALNVLLTYLAGSSVSVLENIMVEKEQLASSVSTWWDSRLPSTIWLQPTSVATEKLADVEKRLFEILRQVVEAPLDMAYMIECIKRERRQLKFQAESSGEFFATNAINDFLFGKRDGSTLKDIGTIQEYDVIESWTERQWKDYLKKWIVDAEHVSILGKPSKAMAQKLEADEKARVAAQKEKLGPEGLEKLAKRLEDAKTKNNAPIPDEILKKWPVPGVNSIHFINTTTARSGLARQLGTTDNSIQKVIDSSKESPIFVQFEHVPTSFVLLSVLLGTSDIPLHLLPLLSVFIENFFNTPILRNGEKIDFQHVVTELEKDTISYSINGGSRMGDAEGLAIQFQIEPDKYEKTIEWIRTLMFDSVFDETRLQAALTKMLADIPDAKRSGSSMLSAVDAMIHLAPQSAVKARGTLVKAVYLKRLKKLLEKEPETVISMFNQLRGALCKLDNVHVLVIANVEKLPHAAEAWDALVKGHEEPRSLSPIVKQHQRLSEAGKNPGDVGAVIVPMSTIDSSFALSSAKGPTSYQDPQLPALMVAVSYLDAVEGPLWSAIRGTGLAYGTGFSRDLDGGFMQFRVYRSPDAYKAFTQSRDVVRAFVDGSVKFEDHALEGARSAIVVAMADEQPTMASAAQVSFVNSVIRGLDKSYNAELLAKIKDVSIEDIKKAMEDKLLPAFTPGVANVVVTCAPIMEEVCLLPFVLHVTQH
jgi:Zn-dependent M16 (insulinase) family peptidase